MRSTGSASGMAQGPRPRQAGAQPRRQGPGSARAPLAGWVLCLATLSQLAGVAPAVAAGAPSMAEILAAAPAADWRSPDPARTLYLELPQGRVVFELAPRFAPRHLENLRRLAQQHWFDGLAIVRVQDNFVVQWGDPDPAHPRPLGAAARSLAPEFSRDWPADLPFTRLEDPDGYAADVGFVDGFPVAGDRRAGRLWMAHCYGTLAVGRDEPADSGNAGELYVVIGHAPRQLDRNATVLGRVLQGIEWLSSLPRGGAVLGFYARESERVPIRSLRFADQLPPAERVPLEVLRTESTTFSRLVEARRNRRDGWYVQPAGHIDLCSVPLPVRSTAAR